jgi:amidase
MDAYDVVVAPSLAEPPVLLDTVGWRTEDPMGLFTRSAAFTPFTAVANVTGQPAISLPLHRTASVLPVGVQLVAPHGAEDMLLRVAAQLEEAHPWGGARPPAPGG